MIALTTQLRLKVCSHSWESFHMCLFSTAENIADKCSHILTQDFNFPTSALTAFWSGKTDSLREVTVSQKKKAPVSLKLTPSNFSLGHRAQIHLCSPERAWQTLSTSEAKYVKPDLTPPLSTSSVLMSLNLHSSSKGQLLECGISWYLCRLPEFQRAVLSQRLLHSGLQDYARSSGVQQSFALSHGTK